MLVVSCCGPCCICLCVTQGVCARARSRWSPLATRLQHREQHSFIHSRSGNRYRMLLVWLPQLVSAQRAASRRTDGRAAACLRVRNTVVLIGICSLPTIQHSTNAQGTASHSAIHGATGGNPKPWITTMHPHIQITHQRHIQCRTAVQLAGDDGGTAPRLHPTHHVVTNRQHWQQRRRRGRGRWGGWRRRR